MRFITEFILYLIIEDTLCQTEAEASPPET